MKTLRSLLVVTIPFTFTLTLPADQNLAGNVTITGGAATGNLSVTGAIDSDGNALTFGTQGASFGAALQYQDSSTDTFTFSTNRNPASWLWLHSTAVPAMRLDASHQLILYQSDGSTAGVTFTPANNSIKLGTHASGTLIADANGVITAGGGFTVAGDFTNTNGSLTGGVSGLTLNAGGTSQSITLNSSGGDLVFSTNSTERMRIKSTGMVGINRTSPNRRLDVNGDGLFSLAAGQSLMVEGAGSDNAIQGPNLYFTDNSIAATATALQQGTAGGFGLWTYNGSWGERLHVTRAGNVGIGTTSPGSATRLQVNGRGLFTGGVVDPGDGSPSGVAIGFNTSGSYGFLDAVQTGVSARPLAINASGGNVGIGTTTPGNRLTVRQDLGNPADTASVNIEQPYAITSTDTDYIMALDIEKYWYSIPSGITANGYQIGIASQVFVSDTSFQGTIAEQYGIWSRTGINVASSTGPRTINNAYGIYLEGISNAGTVSNHYGVYQTGVGTKNYFAGNVGIGTTNPQAKLQVGSWNLLKDGTWAPPLEPSTTSAGERIVFYQSGGWKTAIGMDGQNGIWFQTHTPGGQVAYQWFTGAYATSPTERMRMMDNGNVGIGTTTPTHKLAVNGTIRAKEVIVDTGWADYVFDEDYRLAPLAEVESHIKAKGHLPGIPSAAEVSEHGVSMGDMQARLLAKVEELTLHLIRMEKENTALRERVQKIEGASATP